jgi:hypothetical protein
LDFKKNCLYDGIKKPLIYKGFIGEGRIRTFEGIADRFTVCSLWPLGNLTVRDSELVRGLEPPTY